jgi:hypothetical protein
MDKGGTRVLIEGRVLRVWDRRHRLLAWVQRTENRMYRLELQVARPLYLTVHQDDDAWRWYERLGHANFGSLEKMGRLEIVRGLPPISHAEQFCDTCVLAKHRRGVFPKQSKYCADKALELVHDGISLVLLIFVVLCMVVYYWSLWSFAWWLEGQHLIRQHIRTAS